MRLRRGLMALVAFVLPVSGSITALDGFGNAVDWFFVLKLPNGTFPATELWQIEGSGGWLDESALGIGTLHCNCPDPTCDGMPYPEYGTGKGPGLCYLYADSNNPTLRYFTNVTDDEGNTLECLGQGGNDPLSQTMRQLQNEENYDSDTVEWAIWNDELQSLADSYNASVCAYSAYAEYAYPYTSCTGDAQCGYRCSGSPYAQCSSDSDCSNGTCELISCTTRDLPHYNNICSSPYGHSKGALAYEESGTGFFLQGTTPNWPDPSQKSTYTPLGCQLDSNTDLSQSFLGLTLDADTFSEMAPYIEAARLCSTGTTSCRNGSAGHMIDFNCTSEQTRAEDWSILDTAFSGTSTSDMHSSTYSGTTSGGVDFKLIAKAEADAIPPWLLVASELGVDLGVSSWLDFNYGFASLCSGDDYSSATNQMCLVSDDLGISLNENGGAVQSVENALAASFEINGVDLAWALWGEFTSIASHAKFAIASEFDNPWFVSGDENNQGWSCSTSCSGSQSGRGGLFFALNNSEVHASIYDMLKIVCACNEFSQSYSRFCSFGCYWKNTTSYMPDTPMYQQNTSFWDKNEKSWIP